MIMFQKIALSLILILVSSTSFAQAKLLTEEELELSEVFTDIDKALKDVEKVYILDLSSKGLDKLPKTISRFRNLQKLILTDNQLTEVPAELGRLKKLQTLYIDSNNIQSLYFDTSDPRAFQNIEYLYVGFNPLKTIPENIKDLELSLISLAGCKYLDLKRVFTPLASIETLIELDLSYLNLDTIPFEVANLYGLAVLDLSANPSMDWDTSLRFISQNKSIEEIIMQHNKLSMISEEFARFTNLTSLDLSYNDKLNLNEVFEVTKNIEQLRTLDISHCELRALPNSISDNKKLFELYLNNNNLSTIPSSIGRLEALELIDISHNNITQLPEEFGNLQNLEYCILSNNPLEFLPQNMENLVDLKYLELPKKTLNKDVEKSIKKMFKETEIEFVKSDEEKDN